MAINQKLGLDDGNQQLDEDDISNIERAIKHDLKNSEFHIKRSVVH